MKQFPSISRVENAPDGLFESGHLWLLEKVDGAHLRFQLQDSGLVRFGDQDKHFEGACKYRVGVAIRRPIVDLVTEVQLRADSGDSIRPSARGEKSNSERAASTPQKEADGDCECGGLPDSAPCWPCFRNGRKDFE